jgi:hypothetical protein
MRPMMASPMHAPNRRAIALAGLLVFFVLLVAGCGGASTDGDGFTSSQRAGAERALSALAETSVYDTALDITQTAAEDPTACQVHIQKTNPLTFEVFMTWVPNVANMGGTVLQQAASRLYSWVRAIITPAGVQGYYSFHEGNDLTLGGLEAQYGDAFAKPSAKCLLLQNDAFGLLPAGSV